MCTPFLVPFEPLPQCQYSTYWGINHNAKNTTTSSLIIERMIMARSKNRQIHPLPKSHECTNLLSFLASVFRPFLAFLRFAATRQNEQWPVQRLIRNLHTRPLNFHFQRSLSRSPLLTTTEKKNVFKSPPSQCCFTKIYVAFVHRNGWQHPTAATDNCVWSLGAARSSFPRFQRQVGFIGLRHPGHHW